MVLYLIVDAYIFGLRIVYYKKNPVLLEPLSSKE